MDQLSNLSNLSNLSSMPGIGEQMQTLNSPGYKIMSEGDINTNINEIGARVTDNLDQYINNPSDTPANIKAQIKKDLFTIYYSDPGNNTKVKTFMKDEIGRVWYTALKARNNKILKELDIVFKRENEFNNNKFSGDGSQGGGGGNNFSYSDIKNGIKEFSESQKSKQNGTSPVQFSDFQNDLTAFSASNGVDFTKANPGQSAAMNNAVDSFSSIMSGDTNAMNGILSGSSSVDKSSSQGDASINNKPLVNDHFGELINYKSDYFKSYFDNTNSRHKHSEMFASVSEVYNLHNNILTKVLYNYAIIDRKKLINYLRTLILGEDGISIFENKMDNSLLQQNANGNGDSIYSRFIDRLRKLGDSSRNVRSRDIMNPMNPINNNQTGGDGDVVLIPKYIPSTYNWKRIQGYVSKQVEVKIAAKLNVKDILDAIKEAFKEVFSQANTDSLNMDPDDIISNKQMHEYLNTECGRILVRMCEQIPNNYAVDILRKYVFINFDTFTEYLNPLFISEVSPIEKYFFSNKHVPKLMFDDKHILPITPKIKFQTNTNESNTSSNATTTSTEEVTTAVAVADAVAVTTDVTDAVAVNAAAQFMQFGGASDGVPTESNENPDDVSQYLRVHNIESVSGIPLPFWSGNSIFRPVFKVYKKQYNQLSEDKDFLAPLFAMYSDKSIEFMQQIQTLFKKTDTNTIDDIDDYIERFILTRHSYTTKIISDCIRHVVDITQNIIKREKVVNSIKNPMADSDNAPIDDATYTLLSKYAVFLMYTSSYLEPIVYGTSQQTTHKHIEYIINQINSFKYFQANETDEIPLSKDIIEKIINTFYPETDKSGLSNSTKYDKELEFILERNKPVTRKTKKNHKNHDTNASNSDKGDLSQSRMNKNRKTLKTAK